MANNYSKTVQGLIDLGMTEREAKVYLALLEKGSATAPLLQKISGVPQSKIYSTIDGLVRKGFFKERKVERSRQFEIIDPEITLGLVIQKMQTQLESSAKLMDQLVELHKTREKVTEPFEYIEIVHGNENVHAKYVELLRNAQYEALNFTRPPFASVTKEMYEEQMILLQRFLDGGGKVKGVFEVNADSPPRIFDVCHKSYEYGEKFRIAEKLPLKMYIFDRKNLLIADKSSLAGEDEISMTVIKQKTTVDGYVALFEFFWDQSEEYEKWIRGKEELMERKLAEQ